MKTTTKIKLICLIGLIGLVAFPLSRTTKPVAGGETVVLLHGLARSSRAMKKMERELTSKGYSVINHDYPSTSADIETLTKNIFKTLEPEISKAQTVHFVTHSMGGMILREHLETYKLPNLGKVVMLAPPSKGSEVTDKLGSIFLYRLINGPAGDQLGTETNSQPLRLKAPEFELGIIAGDRSINPILSLLIPGPDDGKVSVARVRPERYTDYLQLHTTHATMMWNPLVIQQTVHFLHHGRFSHPVNPTACTRNLYACMYSQQGAQHPLQWRPRP